MKLPFYQIIDQIGQGGTGAVYRALDERTGFPVAIKILYKKAFESDYIKNKFIEEANLYLYLNHPNIVQLKDFIIREDGYYLVMEFIDGQSLDNYILNISGPIPEEISRAIMNEILQAVAFAHKNGVIHLDLKPANIMVSESGDIKVLDFGISLDLDKNEDRIMGSPLYMSPEQIKGKNIDIRSDIYSLGLTLFQMVTGKEPYPKDISKENLFQSKLNHSFLDEDENKLRPKMRKIINRATQREPKKRFRTCDDFIAALKENQ